MPRTRGAVTISDWKELSDKVTPEILEGDPLLQLAHGKLQGHVEEINRLIVERNFHEARRQETTRRIQEILEEGRKEATFLRFSLKQRFGERSEELVRFGMKPFRGRKRKKKAQAEPDEQESAGPREESPE
jgi:hypothetical protein